MGVKARITGGTVYCVDPAIGIIEQGDVHIDDKVIRVIDAAGMIVMPGLVDTHRHTWQSALRQIGAEWTLIDYLTLMIGAFTPKFQPEDVRVGNVLGALSRSLTRSAWPPSMVPECSVLRTRLAR